MPWLNPIGHIKSGFRRRIRSLAIARHRQGPYDTHMKNYIWLLCGVLLAWPGALLAQEDSAPEVAAVRLADGLEARVVGPSGWVALPITQSRHYPSVYLFENDPRDLSPGEQPSGAYLQLSLVGAVVQAQRLAALDNPPDTDDPLLAYLNSLLPTARADLMFGTPAEFTWPEVGPALLLPVRFGDHSRGHLLLVQRDESLLQMSVYAPAARWDSLALRWRDALATLLINEQALPPDTLTEALDHATFDAPDE